jgi:hypothetical protein
VLLLEPCHVLLQRPVVEPTGDPEGPREGTASEREGEASGGGVEVRSPTRKPAAWVRDDREAVPGVRDDDSEQLLRGGPLSAAQTGADR